MYADAYDVTSIEDVYWPVGRCAIRLRPSRDTNEPILNADLATWTPNFTGFEAEFGDRGWAAVKGNSLRWPLHAGHNALAVRSVNAGGLRGEVRRVEIEVRPPIETPLVWGSSLVKGIAPRAFGFAERCVALRA